MSVNADELGSDHQQRALPEVPAPGRIVEVRGATWAVAEVRAQGLSRSPADEGRQGIQHIVGLQSLEEDRLGEELTVVWELEVGHTVMPEQGLPENITVDGFDKPDFLGAFLDAVRWGAVTSAESRSYQAPFRSGADVRAFQLEPLRRALESPRTNLLLADDVGLGKTIEAGLVIQELLLRHRARSVIIVCPPSLSLKWQDEMRDRFGLDFTIVNSELLAQVRRSHGQGANPFRLFPRVIVSMAWLPTARAQRMLRGVLADVGRTNSARRYAFDLLVVDEAHHVAPASPSALGGGRGYAVDSQRTTATRALAERCEHRLFLSATPHNGHSESFTALLEMIDNRRFSRGATVDPAALHEVTVRRLKTQITEMEFHPRQIKTIEFTPARDEDDTFVELDQILKDSAQQNGRKRSLDIVALLVKKRFLSSPWAFGRTLAAYDTAVAAGELPDLEDDYYAEVIGSDQTDEEEGLTEQPEFVSLQQSKGSDPLVAATAADLDRLVGWGLGYEHKPNSRLTALIEFLEAICRPDGKTWTNERVVIFTEYADTLAWIIGVLRQRGYAEVVAAIQGSTKPEHRELIRARFAEDPAIDPIRVLVATDAAGEGIDLQDHCHRLVNFDVPFNPSRLEQRIGRIDRYGQRHSPEVFYFSPVQSSSLYAGDLRFLQGIADKVSIVRTDLGTVNPLLAVDDDIQQHFSPNAARRTRSAPSGSDDAIRQTMAGELTLNRDLTALSRDYASRKAAMHLTPFAARRVVDTALALTAQPPLLGVESDSENQLAAFAVPALGRQWQDALDGLATRLNPETLRPISFDDVFARGRSDLVHVHLGHALLQKSARILRSSLLGSDAQVHRVTAVVVPELPVSCAAAVSRLVLVGRGGLRLHEEVFVTGVRFKGHDLAEEKVNDLLDRALDRPDLRLAGAEVRSTLCAGWNEADSRLRRRLGAAVQRRAAGRQQAVEESLATRRDTDIERARHIFSAFRVNLTESLDSLQDEQRQQQAMLWADDQLRQRQRDMQAMQDRLTALADEEVSEVAGLRERYADVQPFVSTAALVFAITADDAATWGGGR